MQNIANLNMRDLRREAARYQSACFAAHARALATERAAAVANDADAPVRVSLTGARTLNAAREGQERTRIVRHPPLPIGRAVRPEFRAYEGTRDNGQRAVFVTAWNDSTPCSLPNDDDTTFVSVDAARRYVKRCYPSARFVITGGR